MRARIPYALVVCLALCAACDNSSGDARGPSAVTAPSAPTAPGSPANRHQPILITSGDDGNPVVGARVTINQDEFYSAPSGEVVSDVYSGADIGAEIDVDAKGFLPRRTRLTAARGITLWPVANQAEEEAVREMVYRRGQATDQVLHSACAVRVLRDAHRRVVRGARGVEQGRGHVLQGPRPAPRGE